MKELSNIDIDSYFRNFPTYGGCIDKAEIVRYEGSKKFYIINLDKLRGQGTHWVLCSMLRPDIGIYIDPFGAPPPNIVVRWMKRHRKTNIYSTVDIQDIKSDNCGYYCIYIAEQLCRGMGSQGQQSCENSHRLLLDILSDFDPIDHKANERLITNWWKMRKLSLR